MYRTHAVLILATMLSTTTAVAVGPPPPEWLEVKAAIEARRAAVGIVSYEAKSVVAAEPLYFNDGEDTYKTPDGEPPYVFEQSGGVWLDIQRGRLRYEHRPQVMTKDGMEIRPRTTTFDGEVGTEVYDHSSFKNGKGGCDIAEFNDEWVGKHWIVYDPVVFSLGIFASEDMATGRFTDLHSWEGTWSSNENLITADFEWPLEKPFVRITLIFDRTQECNLVEQINRSAYTEFGDKPTSRLTVNYTDHGGILLPAKWQNEVPQQYTEVTACTELKTDASVDDALFRYATEMTLPGMIVVNRNTKERVQIANNGSRVPWSPFSKVRPKRSAVSTIRLAFAVGTAALLAASAYWRFRRT